MVSSVNVENNTNFSINCFPVIECEGISSSKFTLQHWKNRKYFIKPMQKLKIADLTRDYFFENNETYIFSFFLFFTQDSDNEDIKRVNEDLLTASEVMDIFRRSAGAISKTCLILKVKIQDSRIFSELAYGVNSFPYGNILPDFVWKHKSSWVIAF